MKDHLHDFPHQLKDDNGADQGRNPVNRIVDIAQSFAKACLIEQRMLEQDCGMIVGIQQHH